MQLSSVVIVLIHLLYATAWAAPTRLDDRLSPRGPLQSLRSRPGSEKKPLGPVQQAVESLTFRNYIGDLFPGRLYRLPEPFEGQDAVVKVTFMHDIDRGSKVDLEPGTIRDIKSLEMVEQYLGFGGARVNAFDVHFIVMKYMGYTVEQMMLKKVPVDDLRKAAVEAIKWYREQYAMEIPGVEYLRNFAYNQDENGKVTARIIGWQSGKVVQGVKPIKKVHLGETKFPDEHWIAKRVIRDFFTLNRDFLNIVIVNGKQVPARSGTPY